MSCEEFDRLLDAYLDERLEGEKRAEVRQHLGACPRCRERAFRCEPTLLLTLAERRPPRPQDVDACVASVMSQVRQRQLERDIHRPRRRWWLAAAAAAVVAIGAGVTWRGGSVGGPAASPTARPAVVGAADDPGQPGPPPRIEVDMPADQIRVYQYADDRDGDSAVYFVVNPALES